jgi:hypothetical protein
LQILAQRAYEEFQKPTEESLNAFEQLDADEIRALLRSFGLDDNTLASLDDDELKSLLQQAIDTERAGLEQEEDREAINEEEPENLDS